MKNGEFDEAYLVVFQILLTKQEDSILTNDGRSYLKSIRELFYCNLISP
jgi:hypothetical protein